YLSLGSFFFFQAEDGIRDRTVTGVQTCALPILILVWAPTLAFLKFDTWQLLINTATTIITFLMVALLQNSQTRNDQATQHKLNAIADGLADLMTCFADEHDLHRDIQELKLAVGLEADESTAHTETHREAHRDETTA